MATTLDPHQIHKKVYDELTQSLRVILADVNLAISATDDSIVTFTGSEGIFVPTNTVYLAGEVIEEIDAKHITAGASYYKGDGTGTGSILLQFSPVDAGDVWTAGTSYDLTVNSAGVLTYTPGLAPLARRIRLIAGPTGADLVNTELYFVWRT